MTNMVLHYTILPRFSSPKRLFFVCDLLSEDAAGNGIDHLAFERVGRLRIVHDDA
jgi:hypothetical protein